MPPILIPDLGDGFHAMWVELIDLASVGPAPWTLVGAHMVAVHAWAAGVEAPRQSRDADVLVNVRVATHGTEQFAGLLKQRGYEVIDVSATGLGHRFARGEVVIDILAPEGIGERASTRTVGTLRTVRVPGGTQALRRTVHMEIRTRTAEGSIPVPTLLGALLIKARAIDVDAEPEVQRGDVAFLLTLITDPDRLAAECSPTERRWLRRHPYFGDPADPVWTGFEAPERGAVVYRRLSGG